MATLPEMMVVGSILLSAGTYLFDFVSNLVVLVEYTTRFISLSQREQQGSSLCDAECRHQTSELAGYFYALLTILICCHSLNALLFKLKFTTHDAPLFAAYFLPLIHLYRLSHLAWRTLSCKGVQDLRSPEMNGLYCILGSALEGVPMLILQFCSYIVLTREGIFLQSMSITFKVSVAASLISAACNGGMSVQSIAKNARTFKHRIGIGVIAAGITLSATLVRCLTFTNLIVYIREYFSRNRTVREQAKFHVSDTVPLLFIAGNITGYCLYYWLLHSPKTISKSVRDPYRFLVSLAFGYMSMILGPLYPTVSEANDTNKLGQCIFRVKLFAILILHLLLDLVVLLVTHLLGTLPTPYLIVCLLGSAGYLVFLCAYMRLDVRCGAKRTLSMSLMWRDGDDEVGHAEEAQLHELGRCICTNGEGDSMLERTREGFCPDKHSQEEGNGIRPLLTACLSLDSAMDRGRCPPTRVATCLSLRIKL